MHRDDSFGKILEDCWQRLERGASSYQDHFHHPVFGTLNKGFPEIRTVILRAVHRVDQLLIFYSDCRSPKIRQIEANDLVSWLFYDDEEKVQLRIKAKARLHHQNEKSRAAWVNLREGNKKIYSVYPAPSTVIDRPTDGMSEQPPDQILLEKGYQNFVLIATEMLEMDWLILKPEGNRRARFVKRRGEYEADWVLP